MSFIRKLAERGISFIIITHDMNLALEYADRAVVLHEGKIIADNTVSAVLGIKERYKELIYGRFH